MFVDRYGSDQKLRAQCVEVRGEDARGTVGLYRSGGTCAGERFRLRLPPVEMALNRQIWEARARAIRRNPPSSTDLESDPLARIARYFCQRPEPGRGPLTQVSLLYSAYWVSYGSGRQSQVSVLTYRWSCTDEAFLART